MTPGKFLRLIWPDQGFYCIAHPFIPQGETVPLWYHKVFSTISEAVTHCLEQKHTRDVYFAILTLRQEQVWNPQKKDRKTGQLGAFEVRTHANMKAAKTLFMDLDVGTDPRKYQSQADMLKDLQRFVDEAKLPMPSIISSGNGAHVYWHFAETITVEQWLPIAARLAQLGTALGLRYDPSRIKDQASVLRVPDTLNWKNPNDLRPVALLQEGAVTPVAQLSKLIDDAIVRTGQPLVVPETPRVFEAATPIANPFGQSNTEMYYVPTVEEVLTQCAQMRELFRYHTEDNHPHAGLLDNNGWHKAMVTTLRHVVDGPNWARKLTAARPRSNADVELKLTQLEEKNIPPASCERWREYMPWGGSLCDGCMWRSNPRTPNPVAAGRTGAQAPAPVVEAAPPPPPAADAPAAAPAPAMQQLIAPSAALQGLMIPPPPKPYQRLKTGEIARVAKDKDGNEKQEIIYEHDLYPIKRMVNAEDVTEQQLWRVHLPRVGAKDFALDADALYDARKFSAAIANNGIYPAKGNIPYLQDYMVAYIKQLQTAADADSQSSHLGWSEDYQRFILPDKSLMSDGTVKVSTLTKSAQRSAQFLMKRGDPAVQLQLLRFFDDPRYIPNQFAILCHLASILFYATGHHGIVVNLSGDAGASKSTTLYTGASLWGDPAYWPINGTNSGATAKARNNRIVANGSLPTPVDEITHIQTRDVQDLVMNVTQPGHRLRLNSDGSEGKAGSTYRSSIMISTANSSLHSLLSVDNAAGTAGSMRVFEIKFTSQDAHTKAEADEYLRQIKLNFGHVGEMFAAFVVRNRAVAERMVQHMMREIDEAARIQSGERFWSAVIAAVLATAEICTALGLLNYDVEAIKRWALEVQVPFMRGTVREEYRDAAAILTDYIAEKHGNILVVTRNNMLGGNTSVPAGVGATYELNQPHNALLGHYDLHAGVLYLLKQGFKAHCSRIGTSSSRVLDELAMPRPTADGGLKRIVTDKNARRTLGAGTNFAKGQSWCFTVDMRHPDIAGVLPTSVPGTGTPSAPPSGNLTAVAND